MVKDQCNNGETGIELINKLKPCLVFLDIEIPNMNGFEMLVQFSEINFACRKQKLTYQEQYDHWHRHRAVEFWICQ